MDEIQKLNALARLVHQYANEVTREYRQEILSGGPQMSHEKYCYLCGYLKGVDEVATNMIQQIDKQYQELIGEDTDE